MTATLASGQALLDWYPSNDDSDITAYLVRRDGLVVAVLGAGTLNHTDAGAAPGATYVYSVEALDVVGQHSPPSNSDGGVTLRPLLNLPRGFRCWRRTPAAGNNPAGESPQPWHSVRIGTATSHAHRTAVANAYTRRLLGRWYVRKHSLLVAVLEQYSHQQQNK
ncbi:MAG: hypothetical protein U0Z44_07630 [Kouleothrix sp.]